jgi:transcriptional regulator with XRE-family HTH domain
MDRRRAEHRGACCAFGKLLRQWRGRRALSQLDLATVTSTSPRHLSFVETGRAQPGRELVLRLAEALDMPLRARNAMLVAAGYAPVFRESDPATLPTDGVRRALEFALAQQEPYPAIVVEPDWTVVMANAAASRWRRCFVSDEQQDRVGANARNAMKMFFDRRLLRPFVVNWEQCARQILLRLRHEAMAGEPDSPAARLLRDLLAYPGAPAADELDDGSLPPNEPLMTVHIAKADVRMSYFSMLTTFGTPHDALLQELRIKLFFPADDASAAWFRQLAEADRPRLLQPA